MVSSPKAITDWCKVKSMYNYSFQAIKMQWLWTLVETVLGTRRWITLPGDRDSVQKTQDERGMGVKRIPGRKNSLYQRGRKSGFPVNWIKLTVME